MKRLWLVLIPGLMLLSLRCGTTGSKNQTVGENDVAEIRFRNQTAELGKIPVKPGSTYDFVFSNTGNGPLTIIEAKGNCHCVQAKWPDQPIKPGDSAIISVAFDPVGVTGHFIRTVSVKSNARDSLIELRLNGEVLAASK